MNPTRKTSTVLAKIVFLISFVGLTIFSIISAIPPSIAQSNEERELEDTIPKHLPIKVKIKKEKEKAFKDLKNEKWVRDLEIEITNTGDKPIYYLSLLIVLPEVTMPSSSDKMGFSLHYGRKELIDIETKARPDDVPIKPGETYVYRFSEIRAQNWERFRQRENKSDAKKLILHFQVLSFGDGTGFVGNNGMAVPRAPDAKSSLDRCGPGPNFGDPDMKVQQVSWRSQPTVFSTGDLPASFLLANFLSPKSSKPASSKRNLQPQDCCPGNGCSRSKPYIRDCFCDPEGKEALTGAFCSDPYGSCWSGVLRWEQCDGGYCAVTDITPCGGATPTPTPTPTPSPSPSQDCDLNIIPNHTNCFCTANPFTGAPTWSCFCFGKDAANYIQYPQNGGCPSSKINNGNDCCVCLDQSSCPDGSARDPYSCQCPPPDNGGGGGYEQTQSYCNSYYLVTDHYLCTSNGHCDYWYSDYEYLGSACFLIQ